MNNVGDRNEKVSVELHPEEWELIIVALKLRKGITVTEKSKEETDRLIQKIAKRLESVSIKS